MRRSLLFFGVFLAYATACSSENDADLFPLEPPSAGDAAANGDDAASSSDDAAPAVDVDGGGARADGGSTRRDASADAPLDAPSDAPATEGAGPHDAAGDAPLLDAGSGDSGLGA